MMIRELQRIAIFALTAVLFSLPSAAAAASFNYIYIEASEGNSSGGHAAIQFGDDIYHFQHVDSGLIRLFKLDKNEFHFLYRYLQNRPMHVSRVEVSMDTFERLSDQFKWAFLTQERQFKLLADLHQDRLFIEYLSKKSAGSQAAPVGDAASVLRLKGVGLFYPEPDKPDQRPNDVSAGQQSLSIERLRQKVARHYGPDFLRRRSERLEAQIDALKPTDWPIIQSNPADEDFPAATYPFKERYADALTALFAVKALNESRPLQSDALLQTKHPDFKISEPERRRLQDLRDNMETNLVKAFDSPRPDWGYAVLVTLARYIAIEISLQSGYWAVIDDFADDSARFGPDQYRSHEGDLRILLEDTRNALDQARESAVSEQRLDEAGYSRIEMLTNRTHELLKSENRRDFRFNGEQALPSKSIAFPNAPVPDLTAEQLTAALSAVDQFEQSLLDALEQKQRYDLITRNCVTELFGIINQTLAKPYRSGGQRTDPDALAAKESEKRLGGYIDIAYNFIPFVSYQSVQDQYHVTQSRNLDSYRSLKLARLKAKQNSLLVTLRESNTLSSRLYRYNPDDALFVFFTDDQPLLRPVFGLANTAAGIAQSVYGFFSWPLDSGKNLKSGATGILMSLPELVFFNMRKGSYRYLSFNQLTQAESSHH